jgi:hypothetical protein
LGRGAFAAGFIALGCITPSAPGAFGGSIEFKGMLNYDTFKRAQAQGVGIRITQSPGGTGAAAMVLGRANGLVIDGKCQSACAWAFVQNKNACFTSRAIFDFHAAHDPGTGRRIQVATDYWLSTVGPELRVRLAGLRSSSNLIRVSAKEMTRYYPSRACGASTPAVQVAEAKPGVTKVAAAVTATPNPAPASRQVAQAEAPAQSVWNEAGVEAMRVGREDSGVIVAALTARDIASPALETVEPSEDTITPFVQQPGAETATNTTAFWPEATQVHWSGVVTSVATEDTELAARHESATGDG